MAHFVKQPYFNAKHICIVLYTNQLIISCKNKCWGVYSCFCFSISPPLPCCCFPHHLSSSSSSCGGVGSAPVSQGIRAYVLLMIPLCKGLYLGGSAWLRLGHKLRLIGSRQPGPFRTKKRLHHINRKVGMTRCCLDGWNLRGGLGTVATALSVSQMWGVGRWG